MKKDQLKKFSIALIAIFFSLGTFAQDVLEFIPAELTPSDTGVFLRGVLDDDNILRDSCEGSEAETVEYFFEEGEYNGFTYNGTIVMPICETKDEPEEGMHTGYVELYRVQFKGASIDSAVFAEIVSPPIQNLSEIYVEFSVDVTPRSDRDIVAWIQYSMDDGATWATDAFIQWRAPNDDKNGNRETYDENHPTQGLPFMAIAGVSQSAPIRLRIVAAWPFSMPGWETPWALQWYKFHLVRVFYWKITADAVAGTNTTAIANKPFYKIRDNVVYGIDGEITVYDVLGHKIATAESIALSTGVYIVQNEMGLVQKIFIKE